MFQRKYLDISSGMSETPAFHPFYSHIRTPLAMQFAWSVHVIREAIGRFCQFRTHHTLSLIHI